MFKFIKSNNSIITPIKSSAQSIAYSIFSEKVEIIQPQETKYISTGIMFENICKNDCKNNCDCKIEFGTTFYLLGELNSRENNNLETVSGYYNVGEEILIKKINHSAEKIIIGKDSIIGKIIPMKNYCGELKLVDDLDATERGLKGFGSTGTK